MVKGLEEAAHAGMKPRSEAEDGEQEKNARILVTHSIY